MNSTWKNNLSLTIFGQSHGEAIGMTLDGIPAGERIDMEALQAFLKRRAPGQFPWSTPRKEDDIPEILSGILNDTTCGAPIAAIIRNTNTRSADYSELQDIPRPGHADYTAHAKFGGHQDVRGGGHFSGRLTAPLCIAGGICMQLLARRGVTVAAEIQSIGGTSGTFDEMMAVIARAKDDNDSVGGIISCTINGVPAGIGSPMFGGLENTISNLIFGIPAVKGVEFGAGFSAAAKRGSENNDPFYFDDDSQIRTATNHHGGILGGISSGMPITFNVAIKPTPSIAQEQDSISLSRQESVKLSVQGRHDPCIVPRAVPCIEAAAAIAILDAML